jgi:hypothetical protein
MVISICLKGVPHVDLDALLAEVLAPLGVVMEDESDTAANHSDILNEDDTGGDPTCTMFQTSREHYGVFYRLDLIASMPELRIILPNDCPPVRMAGFRVRPAPDSELPNWFGRLNDVGMVGDANAAYNHVLFACGEILKNLFWTGNPETMSFPAGIAVTRLF